MSIRYGISLIPEPRFTARVYRSRQLICGQYASWAAEMHMVHLPLLSYFQCPENRVESLDSALATVAADWQAQGGIPLAHGGVDYEYDTAGATGDIFLNFAAGQSGEDAIHPLLGAVVNKLVESGSDPALEMSPELESENNPYRIALMQHANLPPAVFASAVAFAQAVVNDLEVPANTTAWQLALIRFESDAAGEDWSGGRWAADLRWQLVNSHPLITN